ncbi:MAG: formylglycine-generating enzyme family protein [Thermoanaerobaculia bacterium]|nr:formylglycine-generating enzyme family protein [Thermoanaerobaculia bacterium]
MPSPDLELPQPPEGPRAFDPSQSAGLFVGISEFEDLRIDPVRYAVDDAVDLAHFFIIEQGLIPAESAVLALAGKPEKVDSEKRLEALLGLGVQRESARQSDIFRWLLALGRTTGPDGLLLVTLASHGSTDQGSDFLWVPETVREHRLRAGVRVDDLFDDVARAKAERRLVLLDTCRNRFSDLTRGNDDEPMSESFARAIANAKGQVVLSATTHGGKSYGDPIQENGVFSAAVLAGLRGGAKADGEGWITVHELAGYLQDEVSRWVEQNRPTNEPFRGIGQKIDGPGGLIRLVRHPEVSAQTERYRVRRQGAEALLKANLGGILTGTLFDRVMALLPESGPSEAAERLLAEIETSDGSERAKRSLAHLVDELERKAAPSGPAANSLPAPPSGPVGTSSPGTGGAPLRGDGEVRKLGRSWVGNWRRVRRRLLIGGGAVAGAALLFFRGGLIVDMIQHSNVPVEPSPRVTEPKALDTPEAPEPAAGTEIGGPFHYFGLRFVPRGTYWIGSPADEVGRFPDERRHQVEITRGFWLMSTEVTQGQWRELLIPKNPSRFGTCGDDCPVEQVTWWEAVAFANLASEREDLERCYDVSSCTGTLGTDDFKCGEVPFRGLSCTGYRLPTEAEWEVAARAVPAGIDRSEPIHGKDLESIAWYWGNSGGRTHSVCTRQPNAWGFSDMLGNVWEWTADAYADYPASGPFRDPLDEKGTSRVIRGGSWLSVARDVRAADRVRRPPSLRGYNLGFRLARGQAAPS